MSFWKAVLGFGLSWILLIALLHAHLNLGIRFSDLYTAQPVTEKRHRIGFLPVTCHLTCPVADYLNKQTTGEGYFDPVRFQGWPELKEAFLSRYTSATFILAPMAIKLREEGVPIKIVYLGHRDGTAMMVHKDSGIYRIEDLRGKVVAVPNRYSNQRLLLFKALRERGMSLSDIRLVEMAPPDMAAALYSKSVDAISSGEPFMGQTEVDGYGRVLYLTKDIWPDFISCVLAVHEDLIENEPETVQRMVDGIASSGKWLDDSMDNRMDAAVFVSENYYNQHPRLLSFVLSSPPDRVRYTDLGLLREQFEEIVELGVADGLLDGSLDFMDYCDPSFGFKPLSSEEPHQP